MRANHLLLTVAVVLAGLCGSARAGLTVNAIPARPDVPPLLLAGVEMAGLWWSTALHDNVQINIEVDWEWYVGGLAKAGSVKRTFSYTDFKAKLTQDMLMEEPTGAWLYDRWAVGSLQDGEGFDRLINWTSTNPNPTAPWLGYVHKNNKTVTMTTANAKALGLLWPLESRIDAKIIFNAAKDFDFNPYDGVDSGKYDFRGVAMHEIGHALGFISGVDWLIGDPLQPADTYGSTALDLFRYSAISGALAASDGDQGMPDLTADQRDKFLSLDRRGLPTGLNFETGVDGYQACHWKPGLGIMEATCAPGEVHFISPNDALALDVIGWDLVGPQPRFWTTTPEWHESHAGEPFDGRVDFGPVRVGTSATKELVVYNTGELALTVEFLGAGDEFGPDPPELFDNVAPTLAVDRWYTYTPADRGGDADIDIITGVRVDMDGHFVGRTILTLEGTGVGPVFDSDPPSGATLDFGVVDAGSSAWLALEVGNITDDCDVPGPTLNELTLIDVLLDGPDADLFSLSGFTPGMVLCPSESANFTVMFQPEFPAGVMHATLTFVTDQGAPFGWPGQVFTYQLTGTAVREPCTAGLLALGGLAMIRRRKS